MRTSLLIATMLVAVPLATAAPAAADHIHRPCIDEDCSVNEIEEEILRQISSTVNSVYDFVNSVIDDVLGLADQLGNCEVTPDGHIVCE